MDLLICSSKCVEKLENENFTSSLSLGFISFGIDSLSGVKMKEGNCFSLIDSLPNDLLF